jgi:hypothetical protein
LGSYSEGGSVNPTKRHTCSEGFRKDYAALKEHTVQEIAKYPVKTEPALPCDICNILNIMVRHNITLAFAGDSMQAQVVDGMLCEMMRRNYTITQSNCEA